MKRLRLTQEREVRAWSRAELARRSGLHPSEVGKFEAGRIVPYPSQLQKLANALGFSGDPHQLLDQVQEESHEPVTA